MTAEFDAFYSRLRSLIGDEKPYAWASRHGLKNVLANIDRYKHVPRPSTIRQIAEKAGCDYNWLLTGTESRAPRESRLAELDAQREALLEQMTEIGRTTKLDEVDLLRGIVGGVERWITSNNLPQDPDKKAALIALLFSYFKQAGQVDEAKLDELLRAIA